METVRLPAPCLVLLVGPSGAGKTTWADARFAWNQVVSSDRLRAVVGVSEEDRRAGTDAFAVLDQIVEARLRRGLVTVVDSLGLDNDRRRAFRETAERHSVPCYAVAFDIDPAEAKARNRQKERPVPQKVLDGQLRRWVAVRGLLDGEGFAAVLAPGQVAVVAPSLLDAPYAARRQRERPLRLRFGLQISSFTCEGGSPAIGRRIADVARAAEAAGFSSLWVMDHFRQIPQIGPEWQDMLDSYTTLGHLAALTERATLGALATGVGYRNPAHLGKIVASLDVLSGGRAVCGLGIGWFEKEARAYGWEFPAVADRYALLEDTVELLRLMWGPGSPEFTGRRIHVPEAMCYPRPLQDRIPILIGGSGERTTLRLVAKHADMCNLFGDVDTVARKLAVLQRHCDEIGRDPAEIEVSHLSAAFAATDRRSLERRLAELAGPEEAPEQAAARLGAATVDDHIGRFRRLAEAGVNHAIVPLVADATTEDVGAFEPVIASFA